MVASHFTPLLLPILASATERDGDIVACHRLDRQRVAGVGQGVSCYCWPCMTSVLEVAMVVEVLILRNTITCLQVPLVANDHDGADDGPLGLVTFCIQSCWRRSQLSCVFHQNCSRKMRLG